MTNDELRVMLKAHDWSYINAYGGADHQHYIDGLRAHEELKALILDHHDQDFARKEWDKEVPYHFKKSFPYPIRKSAMNSWANFLANEKLTAARVGPDDAMRLVELCQRMALIRGPIISGHKEKLESRRFVCKIAIEMGFDLTALRTTYDNKMAMGRGLLDAWNLEYKATFGSIIGTAGEHEIKRRFVSTKLAKQRDEESKNG